VLFGAIQGLADGLILVDPEGRIVHLNRRAEELLGVRATRVRGRQIWLSLPHSGLIAFWDSAIDEGPPVIADLQFSRASTLRAVATACLSASGRPLGMAILLRDVSHEMQVRIEPPGSAARRVRQ
jgi:PAS domain S-box-containing protein